MITAAVYNVTNSALVSTLPGSKDRKWQDRYSDPGSASLVLRNADADRADCVEDRIVRLAIDGTTRYAFIIEGHTKRSVAQQEASAQLTEYKGRGTMARWEDWVTYPEPGLDSPLLGETRFFNFASTYFDDSAWALVNAVALSTVEQDAPARWPDAVTMKIRPGGSPVVDRDPEEFGVRTTFITAGGDKTYRMFFTGDDGVDIFIDGVRIAEEVRPRMWQEPRQVDVRLKDGTHLWAIKGTNIDFPGLNYSWVAAVIYEVNSDGTLGGLIRCTDATWVGAQFGTTPPGFSPRRVLEILLDEAQARGAVPELTLGGTTTTDQDGTAWPTTPDIAFRVGLDGLGVLRQLSETYIDCAMDPESMELQVWVKGGKGAPSGVVLAPAVNITEAMHDVGKADLTTTLSRWSGGWHETTDAALEAAHRRKEGYIAQGTADSTAEADRVAEALIDRHGRPRENITIAIKDTAGAVPYDDFGTGDQVTAPNDAGVATAWRVRSLSVSENPHGKVNYAPELEPV